METDDELIAEFMGGTKKVVGEEMLHGYKPGTVLWYNLFDEEGVVTYLDFDQSWDWLMPVVEKIESDGRYYVAILTTAIEIGRTGDGHIISRVDMGTKPKINKLHRAVVGFIKWNIQQK